MVQTAPKVAGYFNDSCLFVPDNSTVEIPKNKRGFFVFSDDTETKTTSQLQKEAMDKLLADLDAVTDEPLDEEFFEIVNSGVGIDSGVKL